MILHELHFNLTLKLNCGKNTNILIYFRCNRTLQQEASKAAGLLFAWRICSSHLHQGAALWGLGGTSARKGGWIKILTEPANDSSSWKSARTTEPSTLKSVRALRPVGKLANAGKSTSFLTGRNHKRTPRRTQRSETTTSRHHSESEIERDSSWLWFLGVWH